MAQQSEKTGGKVGKGGQFTVTKAPPFKTGTWEVVSGSHESSGFLSMELPIVQGAVSDNLFQRFDLAPDSDSVVCWHSKGGVEEKAALKKRIKQLEQEIVSKTKESFEQGYKKAQAEGAELLVQERAALTKEISSRVAALEEEIRKKFTEALNNVEKDSAKLSIQIAQRIVHQAAETHPEYIVDLVRGALASMKGGQVIRVRVSPQDHEFLSLVELPNDLANEELSIKYVADDNIKGGCIIETDFGIVDAQLDTMWSQVRDKIFEVL
jgi:flagellar assembly protein FliH